MTITLDSIVNNTLSSLNHVPSKLYNGAYNLKEKLRIAYDSFIEIKSPESDNVEDIEKDFSESYLDDMLQNKPMIYKPSKLAIDRLYELTENPNFHEKTWDKNPHMGHYLMDEVMVDLVNSTNYTDSEGNLQEKHFEAAKIIASAYILSGINNKEVYNRSNIGNFDQFKKFLIYTSKNESDTIIRLKEETPIKIFNMLHELNTSIPQKNYLPKLNSYK
ncbi:hypothetical protein C0585_00465 [Candidatus Woesearchaeota archaeon]|nr:MAG: hypothetical protein C0585_00465 [Candidatus Woesearchaeota archaeon]